MSQFSPAYDFMMSNEDPLRRYENIVDNNGAGTISGINQKSFPAPYASIASLPQDNRANAVANFYLTSLWAPSKIGGINDQLLANHVFDAGVNEGMKTAVKILQEATNKAYIGTAPLLQTDGVIGPETLDTVNEGDAERLGALFTQIRIERYESIVDRTPEYERYLNGWIARAQKGWH